MKLKNKKITLILFLVGVYIIILTVFPLIFNKSKENISYSHDFYLHANGANQIIKEKKISFDEDNRVIWDTNKPLVYPPGFMVLLSNISLISGINVLYLPPLLIIFNWFIFLMLIFATANIFFEEKKYAYLSLLFGLFFISGANFLGFLFLVAPVIGSFLIWGSIIVLLNNGMSIRKKIILNTIFISTLFLTHRPSTITWFIMISSISILIILLEREAIMNYLAPMWIPTIFALGINTILWFRKIIENGVLQSFLYNAQIHLSNYVIYLFITVLNIIAFFVFLKVKEKTVIKKEIINSRINKNTVILLILIGVIFFISISSKFGLYLFKNLNLVIIGLPLNWVFNAWSLLGLGQFVYLKQIIYIFHLGIIPVLLYLPSLYIVKDNKKLFIVCLLPLIIIILTFVGNFFTLSFSKPHRVYIYLIPYLIIASVITTKFLFNRFNKVLKYSIISIIILNIIIAASVTIVNSKPWPNEGEFSSLMWLKSNTNKEDAILSQGYFTQEGRAFGINMDSLYSYNKNVIREIPKIRNTKHIVFLDDLTNSGAAIIGMQSEVANNIDNYDQLYSNANQVIIKKNA